MKRDILTIKNIPANVWGDFKDSVYLFVHGKNSRKEDALDFAKIALQRGYQVLSFDLPMHGDRINENYDLSVWNAVSDLKIIAGYAKQKWRNIYLFGNSIGAYFSLLGFKDLNIRKALFVSPVLNMERLIQNMMQRFEIDELTLKDKREIPTPVGETLNWNYYCYVKENPIKEWNVPTAILYGRADNLTGQEVITEFAQKYDCELTIIEGGEHWFYTETQLYELDKWLERNI